MAVGAAGIVVGTTPKEKEDAVTAAGYGCGGGSCAEMVKQTDGINTVKNSSIF